ncbi:NAD(P)/FAD-dependent oxidoreductase [Cohnella sp.]|uniref:NAD(P)/FAD-dependent oxidoreductase n=1 Tax=Cohnella sp. TaxID=1883426 RepID=UPI0035665B84
MRLHTGNMYWPSTFAGSIHYPPLLSKKKTRVAIVGGGMSGVLCGYLFAKSGIPAILIEQKTIASGSTSANTGFIQYSNDTLLSELTDSIGEQDAVSFYRSSNQAAQHLYTLIAGMRRKVHFKRRSSLYYASKAEDVPSMRKEYELLNKHGFGVFWWEEAQIAECFPFRRAAAIVTPGDAEINPYLFVQALAEDAQVYGLEVFENTAMQAVEPTSEGYRVITSQGEIEAEQIVYAVGYIPEHAGGQWVRPTFSRSYAIVTDPISSLSDWHSRFMIWESARPYLYMRTTFDNRIIIGGLDENIRMPVRKDQELRKHSNELLSALKSLFPNLSPQIRYELCATFAGSEDGLPWIGEDPQRPGQHYCLGYGGNGIIYSMLGAEIIRDHLLGIYNPIAAIVRPDRLVVTK